MEPNGPARYERRLAAILAADVAGYSRLMGADEEGTLECLKALRHELIGPKITEHHGRIVKTTGDGLLVEFPSVVDAVRCAVAVQRETARRNAEIAQAQRIEFRIGIHQGDVIVEDGDIFGDGVNLAARLEGLAEPGGICVSGRVRSDAAGKVDAAFDDLGEQQLKNIARPVRVYRIRLAGGTVAARAPLPLPEKPSLAVLPFQNLSGDPEQEYFADGIVEEITTAISRLPWLFVIARNSSFAYKGKSPDLRQVGRELGVRYALEGSVRKAGNRVRITGQLIDTTTGAHIWSDRFDGTLDDIFELQDQVASNVVGAIEPRLRHSEIERATRKPTDSLDAYDLYLRALAEFHKLTAEGNGKTIILLSQALQSDADYAPAAGLAAWCRQWQRMMGWGPLSQADLAEAVRLAKQASANGKDDPDALWTGGLTLAALAGELTTAASLIERALTLNPNSARAWMAKGWVDCMLGRPDTAIEALQRAIRLSPLDPLDYLFTSGLAIAHFAAGRYEEAMKWVDRSLREQDRLSLSVRYKVALCGLLGSVEEGRQWLQRLLELRPDYSIAGFMDETAAYMPLELRTVMSDGLRKAGLPEE